MKKDDILAAAKRRVERLQIEARESSKGRVEIRINTANGIALAMCYSRYYGNGVWRYTWYAPNKTDKAGAIQALAQHEVIRNETCSV